MPYVVIQIIDFYIVSRQNIFYKVLLCDRHPE